MNRLDSFAIAGRRNIAGEAFQRAQVAPAHRFAVINDEDSVFVGHFRHLACSHALAAYSASAMPHPGLLIFRCDGNVLDVKAGFSAGIAGRLKYIFLGIRRRGTKK